MIFVNSMSDLFHRQIPRDFIDRIFDEMEGASQHIFQVLTKRSSLMRDYLRNRYSDCLVPRHIWCGVSVEDAEGTARIRHLQAAPADVRFLSIEPLLGPIDELNLNGISWVIVGGESGPNARPARLEWVRSVRDQCAAAGVPFFFKQWGGRTPKAGGRELEGKVHDAMPHHTQEETIRVVQVAS